MSEKLAISMDTMFSHTDMFMTGIACLTKDTRGREQIEDDAGSNCPVQIEDDDRG